MPLKNGRTSAALQQILVGSVIPPGTIEAFGGGTVPSGWLLCDGSTTNRSTYSALFAAIGVAHGSGDGSTTFHLPDLRGRFLRGADNMGTGAAGRDPNAATRTAGNSGGNSGNAVGSVQSDAMQQITGSVGGTWRSAATTAGIGALSKVSTGSIGGNNTDAGAGLSFDSANSPGARTSSESRPQNLAVEYIIKV
jgi:microcystin-dependent protein